MTREIMIDLETLGTRVGAPVVAIGAVDSDGREFSARVRIASCEAAGLWPPDADTLSWWFRQSPEAIAATFPSGTADSLDLRGALVAFTGFLADNNSEDLHLGGVADLDCRLWGNSAAFDLGLLAEAYRRAGFKVPWRYSQEACYRTLKNLRRDIEPEPFEGVRHSAVDDARHQMRHLRALLAAIAPAAGRADRDSVG